MKFNEIIENENILKVLEGIGYDTPTDIQEQIMPLIKAGHDVLGQSQTGTGKTLAFAVPIMEMISKNQRTQALILAPTRELAIQLAREFEVYGKAINYNITCVYGSSSIQDQIRQINRGTEIVIGTPGRVKDLIKRGVLKLKELTFFVLDEADEMLSMGFQEELEYIFEATKTDKQVLLFSATMPATILRLAKKYMVSDYKRVSILSEQKVASNIEQKYYLVNEREKVEAMCRVIDFYQPKKAIIFCRTKRNADELLEQLSSRGYSADLIHGDIVQSQRIACLDRFKKGVFTFLIATDVAARGIHVDDVDVVINYNIVESNEAYVHRIGRTGRANKSGLAITFVKKNELRALESIKAHIKQDIIEAKIPTKEDILKNGIDEIIKDLDSIKDLTNENEEYEKILSKFTKKQLENIVVNLTQKSMMTKLGANFNKTLEPVSSRSRNPKQLNNRELKDSVRVFLTIGKLDKISKGELLTYMEDKAKLSKGSLTGMEVLDKFTFVNVKNDDFDKLFKGVNNTKCNNRIIRIEKANK